MDGPSEVTATLADVWGVARAAVIRLGRRPATWVLGGVLILLMALLNYGLPLLLLVVISHEPSRAAATAAQLHRAELSLQRELYPAQLVKTSLTGFTGFAYCAAIPVILGVLAFGGEYGLGTWKTLFTQRPSRLATFAGTTAVMALILLVFSVAMLVVGALLSIPFGAFYGHMNAWPSALQILEAVFGAWLTTVLWASFGVMLSVLFQQTPLAIGIGIVYTLGVEGFIVQVLGQVASLGDVQRAFPGQNVAAVLHAITPGTPTSVSAPQGAVVVIAYLIVFLAVSAVLLRTRDVV